MKDARNKKVNHHGGKKTFAHRAKEHERQGLVAPFISTFAQVYSLEPAAASLVKPPRPKGDYKLSAQVQVEFQARDEDRVKVKELEDRVKMLEEMLRGNNAAIGSNASDGATSFIP
ncbi:hypothetical protein QQ045_022922 [Rhodiola kirilowii]